MRFDDVWIVATGGMIGDRTPVEPAVIAGDYSRRAAGSTGMISYARSALAPPEMAVLAGEVAVAAAAGADAQVGPETLHVHGHSHFQGVDTWPAACWIARRLLGRQLLRMPMTVEAASNGSLAALEIAGSALAGDPATPDALITLADRFAPPTNRWTLSPGMVFGDGAAAAVLGRGGGPLRLVSCVSEADTDLEGLARGDEPFTTASQGPPDSRRRTREFLARGGLSLADVRRSSADHVRSVVHRALAEAGLTLDDVDWFLPPFVGRDLFRDSFEQPLSPVRARTLLTVGLTIGHLGAADHLFALDHLLREGLLSGGDRILLLGTGMGFTFAAAVLTVGEGVR
jgi:3-oxoacyl-[acyl-carrier-protein] synthase-3